MLKYLKFVIVVAVVVVADQISKTLVMKYIPMYKSIPIIPDLFYLSHVHNPGGAFGFLARNTSPLRHWIFIGVAVLALGLIVYFYHRTPQSYRWFEIALAMIFGGAIGNLIDRLRFGEVVDFLDVYIGPLHWPTFNVADSGVTVGVGIFIGHMVLKKMPF